MKLCVIPARGGSKRIPRKNVRLFGDRPMIAWSIDAAKASGCFDRIVVTTDDDEIAEVSRQYGAEVPFRRPAELADDYTPTVPVIAHATQWAQAQGGDWTAVCCIYATAPFLQPGDIRSGLDLLERTGSDYAYSVTPYPAPIQRAVRITATQRVQMFWPEQFNTRSQDLDPAYHDAAQFYWGRPQAWLAGKPIFSADTAPVVLPRWRVQDIDTPEDWECAERMRAAMAAAHVVP